MKKPREIARINGIPIFWDGRCLSWLAGMTINADGAPNCYAPGGRGLDYIANAGRPGNWWALVTDTGKPDGKPLLQGPQDPFPGFYVSTTSYVRRRFARTDPRRYINSAEVPGVVVPAFLIQRVPGVVMGCRAEVENTSNGRSACAMVFDAGPGNHVGEGSIALARLLGIPSNPRNGGVRAPVVRMRIYPGEQFTFNGETFPLQPAPRRR
jgi:hypothetical protein